MPWRSTIGALGIYCILPTCLLVLVPILVARRSETRAMPQAPSLGCNGAFVSEPCRCIIRDNFARNESLKRESTEVCVERGNLSILKPMLYRSVCLRAPFWGQQHEHNGRCQMLRVGIVSHESADAVRPCLMHRFPTHALTVGYCERVLFQTSQTTTFKATTW